VARVTAGLENLRSFHERRPGMSIANLVETLASDRRIAELALYDGGSRDAFRRVRFLVEQARAFEAAAPESLRAFIEWLERRAGQAVLDQEGAALDDDEDALRILTVHASKGLEFPIVVMAGLGVSPSNQPATFSEDRETGDVSVVIGAASAGNRFTLGPVDAANLREKEHQAAERDRLLYVAATRARDHLLVSLYHASKARDNGAQKLLDAGARELALDLDAATLDVPVPAGGATDLPLELPDTDEEQFVAARTSLVAGAFQRRPASATALRRLQTAAAQEGDKPEKRDDAEPWSRGRAATHLGRAVHASLQTVAWDAAPDSIAALAAAQTVAEAVPERAAEAERLIAAALSSGAAARARAARRALREVPFAFTHQGRVIEGFIDLVIDGDDGLEIVDWKTDRVGPGEIEARLAEYRLQAGLYVLGLEQATGRRVGAVSYVFVAAGVELSPGSPSELAAAALRELAAAGG
jgi:ATP-dependent helicase/nuclease subunit A